MKNDSRKSEGRSTTPRRRCAARSKAAAAANLWVNTERAKEGYTRLKQATHAKAEEAWEKYKSLPRFGAAAYALGALCAVLLIVVVVLMTSSPSTEKLPTRAKADEIATMAALRAKMSPNANGGSAGTNLASPKPR